MAPKPQKTAIFSYFFLLNKLLKEANKPIQWPYWPLLMTNMLFGGSIFCQS